MSRPASKEQLGLSRLSVGVAETFRDLCLGPTAQGWEFAEKTGVLHENRIILFALPICWIATNRAPRAVMLLSPLRDETS
jgi:hypothetical protein